MVQVIKLPHQLPPNDQLRIVDLSQLLKTHKLVGQKVSQLRHRSGQTEQNDEYLVRIPRSFEKPSLRKLTHNQQVQRITSSTNSQRTFDKMSTENNSELAFQPITTKLIAKEKSINKQHLDQIHETELKSERLPPLKAPRKKAIVLMPKMSNQCPPISCEIQTKETLRSTHLTEATTHRHSQQKDTFITKTQDLLVNDSEIHSSVTTNSNAKFNINKKRKKGGMSEMMLKLLERTKVDGKLVIGKGTINKVAEYPNYSVSPHQTRLNVITEEPRVSGDSSHLVPSKKGEVLKSARQRIQTKQQNDRKVNVNLSEQRVLVQMVRKQEQTKKKRGFSPKAQEIQEDIQGEEKAEQEPKFQSSPQIGHVKQKASQWNEENEFLGIQPIKEEICEQSIKLESKQQEKTQKKNGKRLIKGRSVTNVKRAEKFNSNC